jgi:hypothetical protein
LRFIGRELTLISPYAIERFKNETLRVYGVFEIHLSGKYTGESREYLAGNGKGKYSGMSTLLPPSCLFPLSPTESSFSTLLAQAGIH